MLLFTIMLIVVHAVCVVRSRHFSSDSIVASIVALLAFNGLLAISGLTIGFVAFLIACIVLIWGFEIIRYPRIHMWRLPSGVVVGFGVMREPVGVIP